MKRIQYLIDDHVYDILNNLSRKNDKSLFLEIAVKYAIKDPEIYSQFSWKKDINKFKKLDKTENLNEKSNISFDEEF